MSYTNPVWIIIYFHNPTMSGGRYYDVCSEDIEVEKEGEKETHNQERDKVPHPYTNLKITNNSLLPIKYQGLC